MNNSLKEDLNNSKEDFQDYFNAKFDMMRLNMAENFSRVLSGFIIKASVLFFLSFAMLFISFAVAQWLNNIIDYPGSGFIIVAGFYFLFLVIFWLLRHKFIEKPIIQSMIEIFFPSDHTFEQKENE